MKKRILNNDLFFAFLMCFIVFIFYTVFFSPRLETNDDYYLGNIVSGAYGVSSPFMVYVNVIYGKVLTFFYHVFNSLNWWALSQYFLILISMVSLSYSLIKSSGKMMGRIIALIVNICIGYELYVSLQYSKTAGFVTVVGFFLVFLFLRKKLNMFWFVLGAVLAILGSYIRIESFLFIVPFVLSIVIIDLIKSKNIKEILRYLLYFLSIFLIVGVSMLINHFAYENDKEWKEYKVYNDARTELLDYGFPDYNENKVSYEELGISYNDYENYQTLWNFDDSDNMGIDTINKLIELKEKPEINISFVLNSIKTSLICLDIKIVFICLLLILILFFMTSKKINLAGLLSGAIIFEILFFYLYYVGRYYAARVNILLWMGLLLIVWLSFETKTEENKKHLFNTVILSAALLVLLVSNLSLRDPVKQDIIIKGSESAGIIEYINQNKENLYIADTLSFSGTEFYSKSVFKSTGFKTESNLYYLGGWLTNSPIWNSIKDRYDIDNPWKALYEKENVFLVDNIDIEGKLEYINENFDEEVKYVLVDEVSNFKIYKLYK